MTSESELTPTHFIRTMIERDVTNNKHSKRVATRFPPEPNGYLHLGHAKSICLNFGIAEEFNGWTNLRFDDTNPDKESEEYMNAIKRDVSWLGFKWKSLCYASDYFDQLYEYAIQLVKQGAAYVDSLSAEKIREFRGSLTLPGKESPFRNRSVEQNIELLEGMKNGDFDEGEHVLRLKIDMASSNINMRDPAIYRIKKTHHYRTGNKWNIYPLYDYTHCLSDAIEGITHSLCTLEFENHRPLYNWVLEQTQPAGKPEQTEFAPLHLEHTILSKRKLIQLVKSNKVNGWDDPRMPTIAGLRRRGYTPASIREFCKKIGVTKNAATIELLVLENCIRDELNETAARRMAVLDPVKVIVTTWPDESFEPLEVANHPNKPEMGTRTINFGRELYIEQSDFEETPPPKFKRLTVGGEVRLRSGYVIRCDNVIKDEQGNILELHCSHDPDTLGKKPEDRKVKGVIHWVNGKDALTAEIRIYDRLFARADPLAEEDFMDALNPDSLLLHHDARVEAALGTADSGTRLQFERQGYFVVDQDSNTNHLVLNRVVALRDNWAK